MCTSFILHIPTDANVFHINAHLKVIILYLLMWYAYLNKKKNTICGTVWLENHNINRWFAVQLQHLCLSVSFGKMATLPLLVSSAEQPPESMLHWSVRIRNIFLLSKIAGQNNWLWKVKVNTEKLQKHTLTDTLLNEYINQLIWDKAVYSLWVACFSVWPWKQLFMFHGHHSATVQQQHPNKWFNE